jgi:hypothetical protein
VANLVAWTALVGFIGSSGAGAPDSVSLRETAEHNVQEGLLRKDEPERAQPYFRRAAECYAALNESGAQNPSLFRNEGNAYLLAGDLPHAILAYQRGLRLDPRDRLLRGNLHYAREQVDYPSPDRFGKPPPDSWPPGLRRPSLAWLITLCVVTNLAGCLLLTRWRMTRRSGYFAAALVVFVFFVLVSVGVAYQAWQGRQQERYPLVVVAVDGVALRAGNGLAYPPRYDGKPLNRGVEARLRFVRDDWVQIELSAGETGWVPREAVLLDTRSTD